MYKVGSSYRVKRIFKKNANFLIFFRATDFILPAEEFIHLDGGFFFVLQFFFAQRILFFCLLKYSA